MLKNTTRNGLLGAAVLLIAAGAGLFVWYNTAVLDSAEIQRLEAGGASTSGMSELLILLASPVLVVSGLALAYRSWSRSRRPGNDSDRGTEQAAQQSRHVH